MFEKKQRDEAPQENQNQDHGKTNRVLNIVGIVLCVILVPILIVNCTLLVKSFINQEEVPDFGGIMPLIVLTDSMYPDIKTGDLIFCQTVDAKDIKEGNVISFFDPAGNGTSVVTHRVERVNVDKETGKITWTTKGINNNTEDRMPVPEENLVGRYTGFLIPAAGHVALFMQSTPGLIVCVVVPIILLVGYDLLRRRRYDAKKTDDMATLMAELEALKAAAAKAEADKAAKHAEPTNDATVVIAEKPTVAVDRETVEEASADTACAATSEEAFAEASEEASEEDAK